MFALKHFYLPTGFEPDGSFPRSPYGEPSSFVPLTGNLVPEFPDHKVAQGTQLAPLAGGGHGTPASLAPLGDSAAGGAEGLELRALSF